MEPLTKLLQAVASEIASLSPDQLSRHSEGKWSAGEVLEHLYLTYTGTIKGFERLMAAGKPTITPATLKQRAAKIVVIGLRHMPSGRESPKMARPRGLPSEKVLSEIVGKIGEMDAVLSDCEGKLGRGQLLDHPVLGPLTAREWKAFHLTHGLHHLKQIRRLKAMR